MCTGCFLAFRQQAINGWSPPTNRASMGSIVPEFHRIAIKRLRPKPDVKIRGNPAGRRPKLGPRVRLANSQPACRRTDGKNNLRKTAGIAISPSKGNEHEFPWAPLIHRAPLTSQA
jgi:hypothetical protein